MTPAERTLTKVVEAHQKQITVFTRVLNQFHQENFNALTGFMEFPDENSRASMSRAIAVFNKSERMYKKAVVTYYATPNGE